MPSRHTLVVLRHAKTEPFADTDFSRELTARGRRDACAIADWFAEQDIVADAGLVSAARRTRETWAVVADVAGWDAPAFLEEGLYGGDEDSVIDQIRLVEESVGTLVVVGHNPTMSLLAHLLTDEASDHDAMAAISSGYPTSGAAVFEVDRPWAELAAGTATLRAFHVGRG